MKTSSAETIVTNNLLELKGKYDGVGMDREREMNNALSTCLCPSALSLRWPPPLAVVWACTDMLFLKLTKLLPAACLNAK